MLGHSMQMVVNQGGELLEGGLVALAPGVEQLGDLVVWGIHRRPSAT
jgi:hypothetical protein